MATTGKPPGNSGESPYLAGAQQGMRDKHPISHLCASFNFRKSPGSFPHSLQTVSACC